MARGQGQSTNAHDQVAEDKQAAEDGCGVAACWHGLALRAIALDGDGTLELWGPPTPGGPPASEPQETHPLRRGHVVSRYPLGPGLLAVPFEAPQVLVLDHGRIALRGPSREVQRTGV